MYTCPCCMYTCPCCKPILSVSDAAGYSCVLGAQFNVVLICPRVVDKNDLSLPLLLSTTQDTTPAQAFTFFFFFFLLLARSSQEKFALFVELLCCCGCAYGGVGPWTSTENAHPSPIPGRVLYPLLSPTASLTSLSSSRGACLLSGSPVCHRLHRNKAGGA